MCLLLSCSLNLLLILCLLYPTPPRFTFSSSWKLWLGFCWLGFLLFRPLDPGVIVLTLGSCAHQSLSAICKHVYSAFSGLASRGYMMQSVCERQPIRLETFSFTGEEGRPRRGEGLAWSSPLCVLSVCGAFIYPQFCEANTWFYDMEVTNSLDLRQSQEHGTVVMAGNKKLNCITLIIDTQLIIGIQWQRM